MMKELSYKQNDIIFKQDDPASEMYIVNSGKVGIFVNYATPAQRLLGEISVGAYFGEMSIIDNVPHSATAVALTDVLLTGIGRDTFNQFIAEHPEIATEIMQTLSGRLRALMNDFMDACRAISESMEDDNKPKKPGLFNRLKKYADMYVESTTIVDEKTGERMYVGGPYLGGGHGGMLF